MCMSNIIMSISNTRVQRIELYVTCTNRHCGLIAARPNGHKGRAVVTDISSYDVLNNQLSVCNKIRQLVITY